ncbi:MAG: lysylphosphatidylglycerol synthase transmembrane domain-containing protein [Jatrophihabitantaceae bacterium]
MTVESPAQVAESPISKRGPLARLMPLARPLVALLVLAAIGYAVASNWSGKTVDGQHQPGVRDALHMLAWPSVVLSLLAAVIGTAASLMAWRALLADEGYRLTPLSAGRIFFVGQLGKYLPGSVWSVVMQMELAKREGVPRGRAFTTSLVWVGLSLSTALTVGLLGLPVLAAAKGHQELWWLLAALPVLIVASLPPVLTRLVNLVLRLFRKGPLPRPLSWRGVLTSCAWLVVTWVFFGVHLWLLANALGAPGVGGLIRCIGGFALAMAAGVLFVIVPSGAGVREIIIVAALAPVMSGSEALGIAVVSRVLFIFTDVAEAGVAAISGIRRLRGNRGGVPVQVPLSAK